MNRISLYEAIRRQKESQGLTTAPKSGTVPTSGQRTDQKTPLKQVPAQAKPALPVKPAVKSPIKTHLTTKSPFFKKEKNGLGRLWVSIRDFRKKNPTTTWIVTGGCGIVLILVLFLYGLQYGQNSAADEQSTADKPAQQNPAGSNRSFPVGNTAEVKTQAEKPVAARQEAKPVTGQIEKPVVVKQPVIEKQAESPKQQTKTQLPAVIQNELQKQAEPEKSQPAKPEGDHIIVIVAYTQPDHLVPVSNYFRQNGIETEVLKQGSYYLLVTKQRFENPERAGTDGSKMKQTIKRIGANYKAPDGYERFAATPFQDVYGKKVK